MGGSKDANETYRAAERKLWRHYGIEPRERFVEAGPARTRIRVTEVGNPAAPPVVFIGGTGGTGPYWAPLVAALDARALIMDRPGFGLSVAVDYAGQPYGALVAGLVEDVLDGLEIADAGFVGASIGDVWALLAAERLPERVRKVVLLGGGPLTSEVTPPLFIKLLRSPFGALIVRVPQKPKMLRSQLAQMGHASSIETGRFPEAFFEWNVALSRSTPSMRHERTMVQAVLGRDGFIADLRFDGDRRALVKAPVLMVVGSADPVGSVDIWTRFVDGLPDGVLRVLDDAGHLSWWDNPAQVADWVREHLADR